MIFSTCRKKVLRLVRGATHTLELRVYGPDGRPYELLEGDVIRFGVKYDEGSTSFLLKKQSSELNDGVTWILIEAEDTLGMEAGEYKFDVGLQSGDYYFPIVRYSDFILEPNITTKE